MSDFTLRRVEEGDRLALLDLWQAAWTPVMPQIDFAARRDWFDAFLRELEMAGAVTLVAEAGVLIGFINYHPVTGYIDQIAVKPAAQRRGVAGALLAAARQACPSGLGLKVNQQNHGALRFYQREGFKITGTAVGQVSGLPLWEMAWRAGE